MLKENRLPSLADKIIAKAKEDQKIEEKKKKTKKIRGISRTSIRKIKFKK